MRASSELHLRSVWSFPFDFQSTPPHEGALVYGLSLLMLLSRGTLTPCFIAMPGAIPQGHARRSAPARARGRRALDSPAALCALDKRAPLTPAAVVKMSQRIQTRRIPHSPL